MVLDNIYYYKHQLQVDSPVVHVEHPVKHDKQVEVELSG